MVSRFQLQLNFKINFTIIFAVWPKFWNFRFSLRFKSWIEGFKVRFWFKFSHFRFRFRFRFTTLNFLNRVISIPIQNTKKIESIANRIRFRFVNRPIYVSNQGNLAIQLINLVAENTIYPATKTSIWNLY